jgi:hypothetical protein
MRPAVATFARWLPCTRRCSEGDLDQVHFLHFQGQDVVGDGCQEVSGSRFTLE